MLLAFRCAGLGGFPLGAGGLGGFLTLLEKGLLEVGTCLAAAAGAL